MHCPKFTLAAARAVLPTLNLPRGITPQALLVGMNVEREHLDLIGSCNPRKMGMVAAAHFRERKDYYVRLLKYVER